MKKLSANALLIGVFLLLLTACKETNLTESRVIDAKQTHDFVQDVKPILDRKCLVCHSCYDAPCQLKMESGEGLERGASKQRVYDGSRLKDVSPTRLYLDAQTAEQWRSKGFYSVLASYLHSQEKTKLPLMQQMLTLGHNKPLPSDQPVPESVELGFERVNFCPAPGEFAEYASQFPHGGMPLAVSGLEQREYRTLMTWLNQGAKIEVQPTRITEPHQGLIRQWESWLNKADVRSKLVSRYIYEHLYLGHLYLDEPATAKSPAGKTAYQQETRFYQLVRSYTPPGKALQPVPTVRPNDDPGRPVFYRLFPVIDTIVHKTHITYRFDDKRLQQFEATFFGSDWALDTLPGYSYSERANPFLTFKAIPAKSRYRFLLEEAEFFVRNFIRGPVCRGQIATNVIRDHFWVMFENPDDEQYSNDVAYQTLVNPFLGLPGEKTALLDFGSEWLNYSKDRNRYLDFRQQAYRKRFPSGASLAHIWDGDSDNDNAFLTVYRHHNSASVSKGWQGELPLTTWLMDYPLFERTFYELVVGFDVFGSVSHQAQTRLYFDLIRNGSETNFLRLLPAQSRQSIYANWYQSAAKIKTEIAYHELDLKTPTQINYTSAKPAQELLKTLLDSYPVLTGGEDAINRCPDHCKGQKNGTSRDRINRKLSQLAATPASRLPVIKWLPEVTFVRVNHDGQSEPDGRAQIPFSAYTLLRNRRHSSVAFLLGESLRYQETLDSLTILQKPVGSYPNLMLQINESEMDDFIAAANRVDSDQAFNRFIERWGVRRMSARFWPVFHGFTDYVRSTEPLQAGIYDMNRYGHW